MPHYYSSKQEGPLRLRIIKVVLRGNALEFSTGSGVFSVRSVDKGSKLLIEKSEIQDGWRILDLGSGYGPVGIAVAKAFPNAEVLLTDINQRAVKLARKNIKDNKVTNAKSVSGDRYAKVQGLFDAILLNPPQSAGKDVCFSMIDEAPNFLKPGGMLQIVARHQKGGKTLSSHMEEVFGNLETLAKSGGYRVYASKLKSP